MIELKTHNSAKENKDNSKPKPVKPEFLRINSQISNTQDNNSNISLNNRDIYNFTRHLSNLLIAGMEIPVALEILSAQTNKQQLKLIVDMIREEVNAGKSLADALNLFPETFSEMYVNIVLSAQSGGELDKALEYLADMLEKRNKINSQVNRALIYPTLMLTISAFVVIFLMTTVIPNITSLFLETERQLPLITRSLIFLSNIIKSLFPITVIIVVLAYFSLKIYMRNPENKARFDRKILNLPFLGKYILDIETVRLSRSLCAMLKGGLTIVESMELANGAVNNSYIKSTITNISNGLTKGYSIEESFRKYGKFQPMVHHAIAIGESTGELEKQLKSISDIIDEDIDNKTNIITTMLEPVIMLLMGLLTGYIVTAMMLPIFEINTSF